MSFEAMALREFSICTAHDEFTVQAHNVQQAYIKARYRAGGMARIISVTEIIN